MGATEPKAQMLRFHTQTGGSTLTAQQPLNNVTRVTLQALAAVLGGTQSLHTNGYDEAISLPTEEAAQLALRTQQIIGYESGVVDTADPLGGSFFIESLTNDIEAAALLYIEAIDAMGGSVGAIEEGFMQNEIAKSAYQYQEDIESGDKIIVGVNKYQKENEVAIKPFRIDDSIRQLQTNKLIRLKKERNNDLVFLSLQKIKSAAMGNDNLMPHIVDAVEAYCTLGEIADAMRDVFGEFKSGN